MTSRFTELAIDCHDPEAQAAFWCQALGYSVIGREDGDVEIGAFEPSLDLIREQPMPPTLLFFKVPEGKTIKNRLHLDLSPIDSDQEAEVQRLLALGASRADVGQTGDESWQVLADPEGNEFCVLRSLARGSF